MGVIGFGLNLQHFLAMFQLQQNWALPVLFIGWFSFTWLSFHYIKNALNRIKRSEMFGEWVNPFKRSFLPAITLTLMLILISIYQTFSLDHSSVLFYLLIAAILSHLFVNLFLINGWLYSDQVRLDDLKPTWFILISGNFVVVISLMVIYHPATDSLFFEIAMFFYAIGIFIWLAFVTILFYRLLFHTALNMALRPSLFIFLAPPSLASIASVLISNSYLHTSQISSEAIQLVAWISYSFASVMFALWIVHLKSFIESGLSITGWSYVYPLSAYGLATQFFAEAFDSLTLKIYSFSLLLLVSVIILLLFHRLYRIAYPKP